jgi:hypothetical protein
MLIFFIFKLIWINYIYQNIACYNGDWPTLDIEIFLE